MTWEAGVGVPFLGTDECGVGAEAILSADGTVTIQNTDGDGVVLTREQVEAFVSFFVPRMTLEVPQ